MIIPPDKADRFGNGSAGLVSGIPLEYQVCYDRTNFSATTDDVIRIDGIGIRMNESPSDTLDLVVSKIEMWASTYVQDPSTLSIRRYENWGPDHIQIVSLQNRHFKGVADLNHPRNFQFHFALQKPFLYDRTAGHLLLDLVGGGSVGSPRDTAFTDADFRDDATLVGVFNREFGPAVIIGAGDVLEISYVTVPRLRLILAQTSTLPVTQP